MYKRRILELSLQRVSLNATGAHQGRLGKHPLVACLTWPRPSIAQRTSLLALDLKDRVVDLTDQGWTKQILFKAFIMVSKLLFNF